MLPFFRRTVFRPHRDLVQQRAFDRPDVATANSAAAQVVIHVFTNLAPGRENTEDFILVSCRPSRLDPAGKGSCVTVS